MTKKETEDHLGLKKALDYLYPIFRDIEEGMTLLAMAFLLIVYSLLRIMSLNQMIV